MAARASTGEPPRRAASLYVIVTIKLLKGLLLALLAWSAFTMAGNGLLDDYQRFLKWARVDPEQKFFANMAHSIGKVTAGNVYWVASGTAAYAVICLTEAIGLALRVNWVGYLAIGEGAFFVPIEIYELFKRFSFILLFILGLNVWVVCYLFKNRHRLFRHH